MDGRSLVESGLPESRFGFFELYFCKISLNGFKPLDKIRVKLNKE